MATYDIVTVGGGLGGSSLARSMALEGHSVLVLERESEFKDRVRGEQMTSWGSGEARELGIYELLRGRCANEMRYWDVYVGPNRIQHRDLTETTPSKLPNLGFFHPEMQ
jgi:2-polyprenyl-6-methoxyphenol hydroxylase-like FAD-dependent oxidoreductase